MLSFGEYEGSGKHNDSILLLPLGVENIERMKVIGKDIDKEVVIKKRNTLII
jgi:hypothetical protein